MWIQRVTVANGLVDEELAKVFDIKLVLVKNHLCPESGARNQVDARVVGERVDLDVNIRVHSRRCRGKNTNLQLKSFGRNNFLLQAVVQPQRWCRQPVLSIVIVQNRRWLVRERRIHKRERKGESLVSR